MTELTATRAMPRPLSVQPILLAGAAAGVLDISAAIINAGLRGTAPGVVLKSVATGVLGRPAFQGGNEIAALGLLLHFTIATIWAAIYYIASRRLPILIERPVICGVLYGLTVRWLMQFVVVPLSAAPKFRGGSGLAGFLTPLLIHIFCVGLPIALIISRFERRR